VATDKGSTKRRAVVGAAGAGLAALLVAALVWWWGRPPQMGADGEAVKAVDALFTAVTARDEQLLGDCERRLHALRDSGRLPADAADYLGGVIAKARAGRWESAAERLYGFMRAQRHEAAGGHRPGRQKRAGAWSNGWASSASGSPRRGQRRATLTRVGMSELPRDTDRGALRPQSP
jgi:hypothetical protein